MIIFTEYCTEAQKADMNSAKKTKVDSLNK